MSSTLILDPFCRRRPYLCCLDSAAFHDTFPRAPFVPAGSVEPIAGEFPQLSAHGEDESHPESFIDTTASEALRTLSGQSGRLNLEALDEAPASRVPLGIQGALAHPRAASVPPPPGATMGNWQGYAGIRKVKTAHHSAGGILSARIQSRGRSQVSQTELAVFLATVPALRSKACLSEEASTNPPPCPLQNPKSFNTSASPRPCHGLSASTETVLPSSAGTSRSAGVGMN